MSLLRFLLRIPTQKTAITDNLIAVQLNRSYERLFLGADGKLTYDAQIVIADLCRQGGVIQGISVRSTNGSISVEETFLNEGRRLIVLGILRRIFKKVSLDDNLTPEEELSVINNLTQEIQET